MLKKTEKTEKRERELHCAPTERSPRSNELLPLGRPILPEQFMIFGKQRALLSPSPLSLSLSLVSVNYRLIEADDKIQYCHRDADHPPTFTLVLLSPSLSLSLSLSLSPSLLGSPKNTRA